LSVLSVLKAAIIWHPERIIKNCRDKTLPQIDQRKYFRNLLLHFRPSTVPESTLRLSLTWGLGGMAAVLLFLLISTGLLLKFVYEPVPAQAYASILYLENQVPFGQLLRNLHHWSGDGLMLAAFLHFLRVFYTGAHAPPRQFNWIIGLTLFAAVVLSNFTGYLLPWDQIAYWAITISTSMLDYIPLIGGGLKSLLLGGTEPGQTTLINFYALHTAILPALIVFVLPFHFWRIRKVNGLVIPRSPSEDPTVRGPEVDAMPHLIVREVAVSLLVLAVILVISMFFNAPLAEQANPGLSPNPTKAPWYFMGLQELLMHFHPVFAVLVIPLLALLAVLALPWLDPSTETASVWFRSNKGRRTALMAFFIGMISTVAAVLFDEYTIGAGAAGPLTLVGNGLLPFVTILAVCAGFYLLMKKVFSASHSEAVQALFTLLLTSFVVMTLIGVWFRGIGMQLMWAGG
jgi:quinol-cytochrome oxidoreductase complex cytochrome b subunit